MNTSYVEGMMARSAAQESTDNKYPKGTIEHAQWNEGYRNLHAMIEQQIDNARGIAFELAGIKRKRSA